MPKAVYRKYQAVKQTRYTTPVRRNHSPLLKWYVYPQGSGSTTIRYFRGYQFNEATGISGTGQTGIIPNISDNQGSQIPIASGYMYITPTEAYRVSIYDNGSKYAEIVSSESYISTRIDSYIKGSYLSEVILDFGSVPDGGRASDGYWYEYVRMACDAQIQVEGIWRRTPEGYLNVGGILRPVEEIKTNNNGIWKG